MPLKCSKTASQRGAYYANPRPARQHLFGKKAVMTARLFKKALLWRILHQIESYQGKISPLLCQNEPEFSRVNS